MKEINLFVLAYFTFKTFSYSLPSEKANAGINMIRGDINKCSTMNKTVIMLRVALPNRNCKY